jgi:sugar phosphate isomerase/epimerase
VTAERFGEELARADLVACAVHASLERLTADLDEVASESRAWGCEYVVVPSLPADYRSSAGVTRFASEAAELAGRLQSYGIKLAYHNHSFELQRWDGRTGLEAIFEAAPSQTLWAELDTYWLQYGGANPASWIRRLRNRAALVHLKDMAVLDGQPVQAEVGEGNLDWVEILSACREAGAEWLIVEQDESRRDPMESLSISYRNLAKLT